MRDPTMDLLINEEQYNFINQERDALELFRATNNMKNFDPAYLKYLANTSVMIYNIARPNVNCPQCVGAMLRPLIHQLHKYEESRRNQDASSGE